MLVKAATVVHNRAMGYEHVRIYDYVNNDDVLMKGAALYCTRDFTS